MRDNKSIEGLRFLLFLSIFLFHALGKGFPMGWFGVEFFLAITGYFYTQKLLNLKEEEIKVKELAQKRALRLSPIYLTVIVAITALYFAAKLRLPGDFFSYFLFAQNFQWLFVPETTIVPYCGHLWYLTLDFYLVLTWLVVFKFVPRQHIKTAVWGLLVLAVAYRTICAYVISKIAVAYTIPLGMMDSFAVGSLLALYPKGSRSYKMPVAALVGGLVLLGGCIYATSVRYGCGIYEAYTCYSRPSQYADNPFTINIYLAMALIAYFTLWLCIIQRNRYNVLSNKMLIGGGWQVKL